MDKIFGFEKVEDIAKYLTDHVRENNLRITITVEPERYEMSVEPWENIVMYCPYHQKEIKECK